MDRGGGRDSDDARVIINSGPPPGGSRDVEGARVLINTGSPPPQRRPITNEARVVIGRPDRHEAEAASLQRQSGVHASGQSINRRRIVSSFWGKFVFWTIAVPGIIVGWIGWGAYRDIKEKDVREQQLKSHYNAVVLAALARIDRRITEHPPETLADAERIIGHQGWCGRFKAFNQYPTATWSFRSEIPLGDTRVWPNPGEYGDGEAVRASVESCDPSAKVRSVDVGKPEHIRRP